jgi:hypothetical protein
LTATEQAILATRILGPTTQFSESTSSGWASSQLRRLAVSDAAVILTTVAIAQLGRVNGHIGDRGENSVKMVGSLCATPPMLEERDHNSLRRRGLHQQAYSAYLRCIGHWFGFFARQANHFTPVGSL